MESAAPRLRRLIPVFATLWGCSGAGGSGDWYYHWNCNGDPQCLATNPTGQPSGDVNEGPVKVNCTQLMQFAAHFWGPAAVNSCTQSPTAGGGLPDGGGGGPAPSGPPTISYVTPGGPPGETVALSGTNLPTRLSDLTITVCGIKAAVTKSTGTDVLFIVPSMNPQPCQLVLTTPLGSATWGSPFPIMQLRFPLAIAVDASSVYWTEGFRDGSIKKVGLSGGTVTALASGLSRPQYLALDGANVYWTEQGDQAVKKIAKSGGAATALASGLNNPWQIVVVGSNVYWTEAWSGTVKQVGIGGGAVATLASGLSSPMGLAVDGAAAYWAESGSRRIMKLALGGGAPAPLATGVAVGNAIALDNAYVYWGSQSLYRIAVGGGTASPYPSFSGSAQAMAVDANNLYWVTSSGEVDSVPLAGGTIKTLATGHGPTLWGIALDANAVYFTDYSNASVKKVAKSGGAVTTLATSPNVP